MIFFVSINKYARFYYVIYDGNCLRLTVTIQDLHHILYSKPYFNVKHWATIYNVMLSQVTLKLTIVLWKILQLLCTLLVPNSLLHLPTYSSMLNVFTYLKLTLPALWYSMSFWYIPRGVPPVITLFKDQLIILQHIFTLAMNIFNILCWNMLKC